MSKIDSISRRRCPLVTDSRNVLFLSLADYKNNLYLSKDWRKIRDLYDSFRSVEDLIEWMKERPKGGAYIHTVKGESDIVVVIATADFNGKFAKNCRENIFRGMLIIFVESGEIPDPYFNISHNVNIGLKEAIKYNPRWIILSSDDMIETDPSEVLIRNLKELDPEEFDVVFVTPSRLHSQPGFVGIPNIAHHIVTKMVRGCRREFYKQVENFCGRHQYWPLAGTNRKEKIIADLLYRRVSTVVWTMDFSIWSGEFIKKMGGEMFDETYVSSEEDSDISIRAAYSKRYTFVDFKIDEHISASRGNWECRNMQAVPGVVYLSYKIQKRLINLPKVVPEER